MSHQIKNNTDFYVVGGTMKADAPSYIEGRNTLPGTKFSFTWFNLG